MYEAMQIITQIKPFQVRAMLQLIFATGMRFNEARNLKVAHIDGQRSCIRIVRGKGGVDREIPLKPTVRKLLQIIYKKRPQKKSEYLLCSPKLDKPLDETYFAKELKAAVKRSAVTKDRVTTHTFRHTFATLQLEHGMNIRQLQKLLGHKSIHTTLRYIHLIEERWSDFNCLLEMGRALWLSMQKKNNQPREKSNGEKSEGKKKSSRQKLDTNGGRRICNKRDLNNKGEQKGKNNGKGKGEYANGGSPS
jgi:integrase